jgi:hypothetical protein
VASRVTVQIGTALREVLREARQNTRTKTIVVRLDA